MLKKSGTIGDRIIHVFRAQHRTDWLVACTQPFGHAQYIRRYLIRVTGEQMSGSAHTAHDFIKYQQDSVTIANLAYTLEIPCNGRYRAQCGPYHRFGNKRHDAIFSQAEDFYLKLTRDARSIGLDTLILVTLGIFIARCYMAYLNQQRCKLLSPPSVAARRQCPDGIAMVTLAACNKVAALRFAALNVILASEFDRAFHGLRAPRNKIYSVQISRCIGNQQIRKLLSRFRRKKAGVRKGKLIYLRLHCVPHTLVGMTKARHRGPPRSVKITLTIRRNKIAPLTTDRFW